MKISILCTLFLVLLLPTFTHALALNLDYPKFGPFDLNTNQNLSEIIAYAYYFIVGIAGLAAFVMLVWGGVQWLASGAVPSQAAEARDKVRNAIAGLLLVLASFLVIQIINPELTILSGKPYPPIDCDKVQGKCQPLQSHSAGGSVSFRFPQGDTREGIFLCKQEQCGCEGGVCAQGTDPSTADYLYINPAVVGIATGPGGPPQPGRTTLGSWNDEVRAVAIRGEYGVLLADGTDYTQTVTCFDGGDPSKGGRLDDFMRKSSGELWGFNGAQSVKVLEGGKCQSPGITLDSETDFWVDGNRVNTVFLFRNENQGKCDGSPECGGLKIRYMVPLKYTFPGWFIKPVPSPVHSIYVSQGPYAALLWKNDNPRSSGEPYMCFRGPDDDLKKYAWDQNNPSNGIEDEISVVEATGGSPADLEAICPIQKHGKVLLWGAP